MADDAPEAKWHLDKRIPIALIVAIVVQTMAAVWWAGTSSARLDSIERRVEQMTPQAERIVRMETKIENIGLSINEIKALLKR